MIGLPRWALAVLVLAWCACGGRSLDRLACDEPGCGFSSAEWRRLSTLSPLPLVPPDPSNKYRDLPAAAALGREFFFDARFSGPATQVDALGRPSVPARAPLGQPTGVSCATCHDLARGGVDVTSVPGNVSAGAGWTDVNALSTVNSAYNHLWFRNGRADSGWALNVAVAESPTTMNGNRLHTAWVITDNYLAEYTAIFGRPPMTVPSDVADPRFPREGKPGSDAWAQLTPDEQAAVTRVLVNWAKALDAYQATLTSGETPFDRFVREGPSSGAISASAKRGARLFVGKAACIDCHAGPLLSDGGFHNVGVPQAGPLVPTVEDCPAGGRCDCVAGTNCLPLGAWDGLGKLAQNIYLRTSEWSDDPTDTSRVADVERPRTDDLRGAWRTPGLRSVALTAPYMHDGVYATLADVVAHYDRGGSAGAVGSRAAQLKPLALSDGEKADLVAFLETLSPAPPGPVPVRGARLAAGGAHTCVVLPGGAVRCWGANHFGQLGNGTSSDSPVPVSVTGLPAAAAVASGWEHTCALLDDRTVRCWGRNDAVVTGTGESGSSPPVPVVGLPDAAAIAAGFGDTCAILGDRTVRCWGCDPMRPGYSSARCYTMGATVQDDSTLPVPVPGLSGVVELALAAGHACAALANGTVRCWGYNSDGELGDGTTTGSDVPVRVAGLSYVAAISTGSGHACALLRDGTVRCWGWNRDGQLGDGTTWDSPVPVPVRDLAGATAIAAGSAHTCAALKDGSVRCWGANDVGQLGNGTTIGSTVPVRVLLP